MERLAVAASLMVPGGSLQDIMEFHQILKHQGEAIERHRALMAGVQRKGAWIPCVIDARARARRYTVPRTERTGVQEGCSTYRGLSRYVSRGEDFRYDLRQ